MKKTDTSVELKVRSIWKGLVGIPDKYFIKAVNEGKDLIINVKGETMHIPREKVVEAAYCRSKEKFQDRFSDAEYTLVYFRWRPTLEQIPFEFELSPRCGGGSGLMAFPTPGGGGI